MINRTCNFLMKWALGASLMIASINFASAQTLAGRLSPVANFQTVKSKLNSVRSFEGKVGSGGGNSIIKVDKEEFIKKMKSEDIKNVLIESLASMSFNEFSDRMLMVFPDKISKSLWLVDQFFKDSYKTSHRLVTEIIKSPFTFGTCTNEKGESTEASTEIGKSGTPICFDLDLIYSGIKTNVSEDEVEIKLAAILLHEVAHHLQRPNGDYEKNEEAANLIEQYFQEFMIQNMLRLAGMPFQLNNYCFSTKPPLKVINKPDHVAFKYINVHQSIPRDYNNGKEVLDAILDMQNATGGSFEKMKKELQKNCELNYQCYEFSEPVLVSRDPSNDVFIWMIIVKFVDYATGHETIPKYQVFVKDSVELFPKDTETPDGYHFMDVMKKVDVISVKKFSF
ncbi:MAG: hypothetical protein ACXVCP_16665 [Bdellovibrio sp.]